MKVAIVQIGNSRRVRLPKAVLEQVGLEAEADRAMTGVCTASWR
jgi:antitoxin component of MazEF toxin-antitoxin module